jgi:hypothetical protein
VGHPGLELLLLSGSSALFAGTQFLLDVVQTVLEANRLDLEFLK